MAERAEAAAIVSEIQGDASIFHDQDRITLRMRCSRSVRALTATRHSSCTRSCSMPLPEASEKDALQLIFTERDSYVRTGDSAISATSLLEEREIPEPEVLRLPSEPS